MTPDPRSADTLEAVLREARACTVCAAHLPLGPRPIVRASPSATLLIIGQAPGTKVHASGVPWDDDSGDRLRDWLAIDRAAFYDPARIAIMPMGLCYPGRAASGGDAPPRPECAPLWHAPIRAHLAAVRLTLLVGSYAAKAYWPDGASLTEAVRDFARAPQGLFPLPHPSWRVIGWRRRNPWFEAEVLPALREQVAWALATGAGAPD